MATEPRPSWRIGNGELIIACGDLAASTDDAIVNAANPQLAGGGGVDGVIHRAAGPQLLAAGLAWVATNGQLATGSATATDGFGLRARHVIHTVGPIWRGGDFDEAVLLASAYSHSLGQAADLGCHSISFPAISCGVYRFPVELAAPIALKELAKGLQQGLVKRVSMIIFSSDAVGLWIASAHELFGPPGPS